MTARDLSSAFEPFDFADPQAKGAGDGAPASEAVVSAYARGYEDATQAATAADAARTVAALGAIADSLEMIRAQADGQRAQTRADAARLALAFARKLAGNLVDQSPAGPVLEAFASLAFDLAERADVTIRLAPVAVDGVAAAFAGDTLRAAPPPRLVPDDALGPGDCRIDWPEGGLIRDRAAIEARLDALLDRSLSAIPSPETTS